MARVHHHGSENPANMAEFEYDTGFVLIVPLNGGADLADGETFTLTQDSETAIFEFDNDGIVIRTNVRVPFHGHHARDRGGQRDRGGDRFDVARPDAVECRRGPSAHRR